MANEKQLKQLTDLAPEVTATPIDQLVSDARWGSLNFEASRRDLEVIFDIVHELTRLPVGIIPDGNFDPIVSALTQCRDAIAGFRSFTIEQANPAQARDALVAALKDAANQLLGTSSAWIPFLAYRQGDVQKNIDSMTTAAVAIGRMYESAKEDAANSQIELARIVLAARDASAGAGVGVFTADFADQADKLEDSAATWLKVTVGVAILTLVVAVGSLFIRLGDSNAEVAQFLTSKILALVVLISATVWCGRIYKATMHQAVTNRHRAHSLKTFQAFTLAAHDEGTKNAVLLESTRSIFAIAPSGYLETTEHAQDSGTKVLEIIKGINAKD